MFNIREKFNKSDELKDSENSEYQYETDLKTDFRKHVQDERRNRNNNQKEIEFVPIGTDVFFPSIMYGLNQQFNDENNREKIIQIGKITGICILLSHGKTLYENNNGIQKYDSHDESVIQEKFFESANHIKHIR